MKDNEIQWNTMKDNERHWKTMNVNERQWKKMNDKKTQKRKNRWWTISTYTAHKQLKKIKNNERQQRQWIIIHFNKFQLN
jgi:hypothetical protein